MYSFWSRSTFFVHFRKKSKLLLLVIKYNKVEYDDEQLFTFFSRPPVFDASKSYVCLQ